MASHQAGEPTTIYSEILLSLSAALPRDHAKLLFESIDLVKSSAAAQQPAQPRSSFVEDLHRVCVGIAQEEEPSVAIRGVRARGVQRVAV